MKKMYIKENFAIDGQRFVKGGINLVPVDKIKGLMSEGFIEEVAIALGIECSNDGGSVDLSNYVTHSDLEVIKPSLKGDKGEDGFPTQEMWDALVARVVALESVGVSTVKETKSTKTKKV